MTNRIQVFFNLPYETKPGQVIKISGSVPELGNWNANHAKLMSWTTGIF